MTTIVLGAFNGLKPIIDPHLLDGADATVARNLRLTSGAFEPMAGTSVLKSLKLASPKTIWRYGNDASEGNYWLEFAGEVDVVPSPIPNDQWERIYWTDGVKPRYAPNSMIVSGAGAYPGGGYDLGLPAPAQVITVTASTPPASEALAERRIYVYTYVSAYGEEGPPSNESTIYSLDPTKPVTIGNMSAAPSGAYNVTMKRIYRSSTVGSSASFQFVAEIPVAQTTYVDSKAQADLGEVLPSEDWDAPPAGLRGLKMMASGSLIGFADNTIYLSEPNMPHAWPHRYPIEQKIVAIGVFQQSAVILTRGNPYIITGVDPSAMSLEPIRFPQACLSKASLVEDASGAIYASPDGLVRLGSDGSAVITEKLMTAKQWRAYNPASIIGALHDGRYHAFFTKTDGTRGELIFDLSGQGATLVESNISASSAVTAAHTDARSDTLYVAQGGSIRSFNTGAALTGVWRSKLFRLAQPESLQVVAVDADAYPVTLRIFADGVLRLERAVPSKAAFTLPGGFKADTWQVEVEASTKVSRVRMASSMPELKNLQ